MTKKPKKLVRRGAFAEPLPKSKEGKKKDLQGLPTFFVLSGSLAGTTPAIIKAKDFKQAHWIYTHAVLIPAKRKKKNLFQSDKLRKKKNIYWDGEIYIEKLKVWKWVKGYPVSAVGVRVDYKFVLTEEPN